MMVLQILRRFKRMRRHASERALAAVAALCLGRLSTRAGDCTIDELNVAALGEAKACEGGISITFKHRNDSSKVVDPASNDWYLSSKYYTNLPSTKQFIYA